MKTKLLAVLITAFFTSCSCDWHLKRAKIKCNYNVLTDTIWRIDTLKVNSVEKDTVFNYYSRDTVVIREGRLTMKYFYNSHDSTVYLNGKCDTIKVLKYYPYIVNNTELKPNKNYIMWIMVGVLVLLSINLMVRK